METAEVTKLIKEFFDLDIFRMKLGLETIQKAMDILGNPENSYKIIHIAGTNGKGSTSTYVANMLESQGYKVGKFTSPEIFDFNERISINNQNITDQELASIFHEIRTRLANHQDVSLTFYEMLTAIMFLYMQHQAIDYLVLEVGLGGKYDATNICTSDLALITNISLDHMNFFGSDLNNIAEEKAGIIKNKQKVFLGSSIKELNIAVEKLSDDIVNITNNNYTISMNPHELSTGICIDNQEFTLPLYGEHQAHNFALAYYALQSLNLDLSHEQIQNSLNKTKWLGRFQVIKHQDKTIILDVAHNQASAEVLAKNILSAYKKEQTISIFTSLKDKDVKNIIPQIEKYSHEIHILELANNPRAMPIGDLYEEISKLFTGKIIQSSSPQTALDQALKSQATTIVISGSFYLLKLYQDLL